MSFAKHSHKLVIFTVETFRRLGQEENEFINQLAMRVFGGRDRGSVADRGLFKEPILQVILSTTQMGHLTQRPALQADAEELPGIAREERKDHGVTPMGLEAK